MKNLAHHRHTIHKKSSSSFSCTQCDYTTLQKSNLIRHTNRHGDSKTTVAASHPPKVARLEPIPNIIKPPANDNLLEQLEHERFESMFEQNTQRGFGVTQMSSTDTTLPDEVRQFFRDEQPWGTDQNLRQVYVQNFPRIRDSETLNRRRSRIYLRYLRHDRAPLIETIAHAVENIFLSQTNSFKINLSFSFILQHRETSEIRYHYANNNNQLLNSPHLIRNQQDLENLLNRLAAKDFPSHLKDQRPNTKWVIEHIVSLRIQLFNQYCEHFQVNPQDFKGIELTDFPQLETRLFSMFLKEDGSAHTLFLSQSSFPTKIYLNVFENHLSLITDHKMYSKQYICNRCDKVFAEMRHLNKHQSKCETTV